MRTLFSLLLIVYGVSGFAQELSWSNVKRVDCELQGDRKDIYSITPVSYTHQSKKFAALTGTHIDVIFYEINLLTLPDGSHRIQLLNRNTALQTDREINLLTQNFAVGVLTQAAIPVGLPGYANHFPGPFTQTYDCKFVLEK